MGMQSTGYIELGVELSHQELYELAVTEQLTAGNVVKQWICMFLPYSRELHKEADGQILALNARFWLGGYEALHPGDPSIPPEQRINCKCKLRYLDSQTGADITNRLKKRGFPTKATSEWGPNPIDLAGFSVTGQITLDLLEEIPFLTSHTGTISLNSLSATGLITLAAEQARCPEGTPRGQFTGPNATNCTVGGTPELVPTAPAAPNQFDPVYNKDSVDPAYETRWETGSNPYSTENPWTADQPYGPHYNEKGKPLVGSSEWLDAHGITQQEFDSRPFIRFEARETEQIQAEYGSEAALAAYDGKPTALNMMLAISEGKGGEDGVGGFIQTREAVDAEMKAKYGPLIGQIRPDVAVVINPSERAFRQRTLENAKKHQEATEGMDAAAAIAYQNERLGNSLEWRDKVVTEYTSPEEMVAGATERHLVAKTATKEARAAVRAEEKAIATEAGLSVKEAKEQGIIKTQKERQQALKMEDANLSEAEKNLAVLEHEQGKTARALGNINEQKKRWDRKEGSFEQDRERMIFNAEQGITYASEKLAKFKKAPEVSVPEIRDDDGVLVQAEVLSPQDSLRRSAGKAVDVAQGQYDKTAIKYAFPPTPKDEDGNPIEGRGTAARVEMQQDPLNVHNFTLTKGRVYLVMEGSIKGSAVLSAIKTEDPTASVIAVPSVTLWRTKEMQDVALKYLDGREVVLVPDADGVNNRNVRNESRALQALLENSGGRVVVAAPPIPVDADGKPVKIDSSGKVAMYVAPLGSGKKEELKGVDDWLGAGDRAEEWAGTPHGRKEAITSGAEDAGTLAGLVYTDRKVPKIDLSKDLIRPESAQAMARAISTIAGPAGSAKVSQKMLENAAGLPNKTTREQLQRLEKVGVIKIEHVYDPVALAEGKQIQIMPESRVRELVKLGVMVEPNPDLYTETTTESPIYTLVNPKHRATDAPRAVKIARPAKVKSGSPVVTEAKKPKGPVSLGALKVRARKEALAKDYANNSPAMKAYVAKYVEEHKSALTATGFINLTAVNATGFISLVAAAAVDIVDDWWFDDSDWQLYSEIYESDEQYGGSVEDDDQLVIGNVV